MAIKSQLAGNAFPCFFFPHCEYFIAKHALLAVRINLLRMANVAIIK